MRGHFKFLYSLLSVLGKFNLPLDKLCDVATDGAPAMVGTQKRLVLLLKNEIDAKGIRCDKLVFCHRIVHLQSLYAISVKFDHVLLGVTDCINLIFKKEPKTSHIRASFQRLLC